MNRFSKQPERHEKRSGLMPPTPAEDYLKTATGALAAHAEFSGEIRELHARAAWQDGVLSYELGSGRVVRVDASEWRPELPEPRNRNDVTTARN
jgi:hypothetical protein